MLAALLQAAPDVQSDAIQSLADALHSGNVVVAAVAGVVLLALVVLSILKAMGKVGEIPFLDPILEGILTLAKKLKPDPAPADQAGAPAAVPVQKIDQSQDGQPK